MTRLGADVAVLAVALPVGFRLWFTDETTEQKEGSVRPRVLSQCLRAFFLLGTA